MEHGTLIFDGNCGFCTRSVRFLQRVDRNQRLTYIPYQHPSVESSLGITANQGATSIWLIENKQTPIGAAAAANRALDIALGTSIFTFIYQLPLISTIQEAGYRWIARNRSRLPGITPYCTSNPDECNY